MRYLKIAAGVLAGTAALALSACSTETPSKSAGAPPSPTRTVELLNTPDPTPEVTFAPEPVASVKPTKAKPSSRPTKTTAKPKPAPVKTTKKPEPKTDKRYGTCKQVIAAGLGPYRKGVDPEYYWYRDPDHDGVTCER